MSGAAESYRVEPTGRDDEWSWQVIRLSDGVVVGWFRSERTARAYADNGGEPLLVEPPVQVAVDQLDLFGGLSA